MPDRQDWTIFDDGEPVGRIYEDASASTPAELRWFWSNREGGGGIVFAATEPGTKVGGNRRVYCIAGEGARESLRRLQED
jgi:hypothetical protein